MQVQVATSRPPGLVVPPVDQLLPDRVRHRSCRLHRRSRLRFGYRPEVRPGICRAQLPEAARVRHSCTPSPALQAGAVPLHWRGYARTTRPDDGPEHG
jgi:hypothetical protein